MKQIWYKCAIPQPSEGTLFRECSTPDSLPEDWDDLGESCFQKREFLSHCHRFNPCNQTYYWLSCNGLCVAGAVVYSLKLDLLTFSRIKSPVKMRICGIPASVSSPGIIGNKNLADLYNFIRSREKGFLLFLNTEKPLKVPRASYAQTLPSVLLSGQWKSFDHYQKSLTSSYRRVQRQTLSSFTNVRIHQLPCSAFTEELYGLYRQVLSRSHDKLECLSIDFFRNLPETFELRVCLHESRPLAWHISIMDGSICRFFLGGVDYDLNRTYRSYLNLLLDITRQAIEHGAREIDYGQTAEIAKTRLGGKTVCRYMTASHSCPAINGLLALASPLLAYRKRLPLLHVFKNIPGSITS